MQRECRSRDLMLFCACKAMNFVLALVLISASASFAATRSTAKTAKSTSAKATLSTTHRASSTTHSGGKHGKSYHAVAHKPSFQAAPTSERYQEIQNALAEHGFFKGETNGSWGPDSVEALKQFQTSQNLPNDGKISSLSLIGLGLGPAHAYPGGVIPGAAPKAAQGAASIPSQSSPNQGAVIQQQPAPSSPQVASPPQANASQPPAPVKPPQL